MLRLPFVIAAGFKGETSFGIRTLDAPRREPQARRANPTPGNDPTHQFPAAADVLNRGVLKTVHCFARSAPSKPGVIEDARIPQDRGRLTNTTGTLPDCHPFRTDAGRQEALRREWAPG